MKTPTEMLYKRLTEITINLKNALNNDVPHNIIIKLVNQYNLYFTAIQLLDSHSEINHKFSYLRIDESKKASYSYKAIKRHLIGISKKSN